MIPQIRAIILGTLFTLLATQAQAGFVRGTVTAASAGTLPGALVAAYDVAGNLVRSATTDAAGAYVLSVPAGAYRLLAYDPQGVYATVFYGDAESYETTAIVQVSDSTDFTANFALPAGGTLNGSVFSSNGPVASAVIDAYNLSGTRRGTTVANEAGVFSMVLPPGEYKVFAYDANDFYAGEFASDARSFQDARSLLIRPAAATSSDFVLERAANASGILSDAVTLAPLEGKTVYAYAATGALVATTTTSATGRFQFSLAAGQYRFVAGDPSREYGPAFYLDSRSFERSDVVTLGVGEQRFNLRFGAGRAAILSGQVMAPERLTVAAYNLDGTLHTTTTENDAGRFNLVVVAGEYKLAAFDPAGAYATAFYAGATTFTGATRVSVLAGQTATALNLEPARAGRFTGEVTANTGQSLGGMTVAAYDALEALVAQTTTAANGTFSLAITPGEYRLAVFDTRLDYATAYAGGASSYEASSPRGVSAEQATVADFVMTRGMRLTGVARAQDGVPVDGIEVFALDAAGNRVGGALTAADGAFTLVVVAGTYRLTTRDGRHRFTPKLSPPITVGSASPPSVTLTLTAATRRRSARS